MVEEVSPGLFRIEVPLPNNPLKSLNSYVVKGRDRSLVIDTGLNMDECHQALLSGLKEVGVELDAVQFLITHLHADHLGLLSRMVGDKDQVYFSRLDAEHMMAWKGWEPFVDYAIRNGFPRDLLRQAIFDHPGYKFGPEILPPLSLLDEGDEIVAGPYRFLCLIMPGHTPGHLCLYEPDRKILISGDHILGDITPNIQCWTDERDPLALYLDSLDRVGRLPVKLTLPGHRSLLGDPSDRIRELKAHHGRRCDEARGIIESARKNGYDIAADMTWDLTGNWVDFPLPQKWFATGEALAHVRYLVGCGQAHRIDNDGHIFYTAD